MVEPHRERWTDPGLSWSQLRAFQACARLSSFNAAATELNLTASAVRHQVGLLEARLGGKLFERQGGGRLCLTSIGVAFERQISRPMRDLVRACATASEMAAAAPIILTAPPLFARQFLFDDRFLKWCDGNRVKLDITDAKLDLSGPTGSSRSGSEPNRIPTWYRRPFSTCNWCSRQPLLLRRGHGPLIGPGGSNRHC
jgi:hypothetical protein